jgi:hypothetical protein
MLPTVLLPVAAVAADDAADVATFLSKSPSWAFAVFTVTAMMAKMMNFFIVLYIKMLGYPI